MVRPALFDDYPNEDLGHHPTLALGLARAAHARAGTPTPLYCPRRYLAGAGDTSYVWFADCAAPRPYTLAASAENVRRVVREIERDGRADFVFYLFLDENFASFERLGAGVPFVHALHRPGPGPRGPRSGRPALVWLERRPCDVVVVHTEAGVRHAAEIAPRERIARIGWPAAAREDVVRRYARVAPPPGEPHILLVGGARRDKGLRQLLAAIEDGGPELRVVGEQVPGIRERLSAEFPRARVRWDVDWAPSSVIDAAIEAASVCVFPYLPEFGRHGGASAALAQALTHPKPVIVSSELADQVPRSNASLVVPTGSVAALRHAIDWAIAAAAELHAEAEGRLGFVLAEHTYEEHLERVMERVEASLARSPERR